MLSVILTSKNDQMFNGMGILLKIIQVARLWQASEAPQHRGAM